MSSDHFNVSRDETELPPFQQRFDKLKPSRYIYLQNDIMSPPLSLSGSYCNSIEINLLSMIQSINNYVKRLRNMKQSNLKWYV